MKHKIIITVIIIAGLFTSCQDIEGDFLEAPAKSTLDESVIFSTAGLAKAAHLSAARAGLLLAGELGPALRGLQIMPATAPGLSPEVRLFELTRFAGSKQHLRLREKIGSGLDVSLSNREVRVEVT